MCVGLCVGAVNIAGDIVSIPAGFNPPDKAPSIPGLSPAITPPPISYDYSRCPFPRKHERISAIVMLIIVIIIDIIVAIMMMLMMIMMVMMMMVQVNKWPNGFKDLQGAL